MLKAPEKTTIGVEIKENKRVTLHEALMTILTTRQGQMESNGG